MPSPAQCRIFSGRTANTEKEEAFFRDTKTDTKVTSNYQSVSLVSKLLCVLSLTSIASKRIMNSQLLQTFTKWYLLKSRKYLFSGSEHSHTSTNNFLNYCRTFGLMEELMVRKKEGVEFANVTPVHPTKTSVFVQQLRFSYNAVKAIQTYINDCWERWITSNSFKVPAYQIEVFKIIGDAYYLNYMILTLWNPISK